DARDGAMRAVARGAARAIGDRDKTRRERRQLLDRLPKLGFEGVGSRWKELERNARAADAFGRFGDQVLRGVGRRHKQGPALLRPRASAGRKRARVVTTTPLSYPQSKFSRSAHRPFSPQAWRS